jgi:hypothetical protein
LAQPVEGNWTNESDVGDVGRRCRKSRDEDKAIWRRVKIGGG